MRGAKGTQKDWGGTDDASYFVVQQVTSSMRDTAQKGKYAIGRVQVAFVIRA
jgi:hypothetical protein